MADLARLGDMYCIVRQVEHGQQQETSRQEKEYRIPSSHYAGFPLPPLNLRSSECAWVKMDTTGWSGETGAAATSPNGGYGPSPQADPVRLSVPLSGLSGARPQHEAGRVVASQRVDWDIYIYA